MTPPLSQIPLIYDLGQALATLRTAAVHQAASHTYLPRDLMTTAVAFTVQLAIESGHAPDPLRALERELIADIDQIIDLRNARTEAHRDPAGRARGRRGDGPRASRSARGPFPRAAAVSPPAGQHPDRPATPTEGSDMNFLKALASGRPMRRKMPSGDGEWLALGYDGANDAVGTPRWREIRSGRAVGLHRFDYEATDWEILP